MLEASDPRHPSHDLRYKNSNAPGGESLETTVARLVPYWENDIAPQVKSGKRIVIAAHGNSLRALVKHLDKMNEAEIMELNIPTGIPLVYELDANLSPLKKYYLGDESKIKAAAEAVAKQGKKS